MPSPVDSQALGAPSTAPASRVVAGGLSPSLLLTAFSRAALLVLVLGAIVWLAGLLPAGSDSMVALGLTGAVLASGLAVLLKGNFLGDRALASMRGNAPMMASRLQAMMAAALGLKLATVTLGVLTLRSLQVKFELVTAFAVAFAAASLVCQVTVASILWRALSRHPGAPRSLGHTSSQGHTSLPQGGPQ